VAHARPERPPRSAGQCKPARDERSTRSVPHRGDGNAAGAWRLHRRQYRAGLGHISQTLALLFGFRVRSGAAVRHASFFETRSAHSGRYAPSDHAGRLRPRRPERRGARGNGIPRRQAGRCPTPRPVDSAANENEEIADAGSRADRRATTN